MNFKYKKIILILLLIMVAIAIAFGMFILSQKTKITGETIKPGGTTREDVTGGLPSAGERTDTGELITGETGPSSLPRAQFTESETPQSYYVPTPVKQISTDSILKPSLDKKGDTRYYNYADGKFYKISNNGNVSTLSDKVFYNVENTTWAPNNDKAVLEYPDQSKIVYDFIKEKQYSIPKHWEDFSFSLEGTKIAAKSVGLDPENRWLIVSNDDGTGAQALESLGDNFDKVNVDWSPSGQTVAFSRTGEPGGQYLQEILLIGQHGENFKALVVEGQGFESTWSPAGQKILYSAYTANTEYKPELWISDAYGDKINNNRKDLKLNTWSNKCAFAGENTLYCGVPQDLPTGSGMAPEINTGWDDLYKIDLRTGLRTSLSTGNEEYTINTISYNEKANSLIFTDTYKNGVFSIEL